MTQTNEKRQNYIVYDLETGGFDCKRVAITEIALIAIDGFTLEETERYTTFIKPYSVTEISEDGVKTEKKLEYDSQALQVTGITMDMIMSGKESKDVVREVSDFMKRHGTGARKKPILCGHNIIDFDNPFLQVLFKSQKKELEKFINPKHYIDTMWWSRMKTPKDKDQYGTHKLSDACSRQGIELVDAHRAMNDTAANSRLVVSYLKSLRGEGVVVEQEEKHSYTRNFKF